LWQRGWIPPVSYMASLATIGRAGIGPLHEQERRNYLFAAKSGGWASVKKDYDMTPLETVPFLRPLQGPVDAEIEAAERSWSEWLAMED